MNKIFLFSALVIMAVTTACMFIACGGDGKDDDLPDGYAIKFVFCSATVAAFTSLMKTLQKK